jgi:hypothetical protein
MENSQSTVSREAATGDSVKHFYRMEKMSIRMYLYSCAYLYPQIHFQILEECELLCLELHMLKYFIQCALYGRHCVWFTQIVSP